MTLLHRFVSILRWLLRRGRAEQDLNDELQTFVEMAAADNLREGAVPADARRLALLHLGGVEQVKERVRTARHGAWLDEIGRDVLYAVRMCARAPGLAIAAALTLALGIGAATAIYSVVYGVLLRPLPYPEPDRIVAVAELSSKGRPMRLADPNFDDFRDQNRSFEVIAKYAVDVASVAGPSHATRTVVARVSPGFLRVFRTQPVLGRDFTSTDAQQGAAPAVLVSYGYWKQHLGGAEQLSQFHLKIEGVPTSVIGVLPAGFRFPADAELWMPTDLDGENASRTSHNYRAVARLAGGVSVEQGNRDISAIAGRIRETSSEQGDYLLKDAVVMPLQASITDTARSPLLVLLGAVGFLLLIACANVANLLLAQASVREREIAVRSALGAGRGRLVRQFLTEASLLSLIGGSLGVIGAFWGVQGLVALAPANLPRLDTIAMNVPVLSFAFLLSMCVACGLGAFTAIRVTSGNLREGLVDGGRTQAGSSAIQRAGSVIVAAQVAIALVLVVGAGLLGRSLMNVLEVNPGFRIDRIDRIAAMDVSLPWNLDPDAKAVQATFFATLIERLGRIPGVRAVGAVSVLPLDGALPDGTFALVTPSEMPKTKDDLRTLFRRKDRIGIADFCVATDGYFQTLGIPLVRGRFFDARDAADAPHVAVVSQSLARERWPGQDPIGRTIEFGNMDGDLRLLTIVGIVGDTHGYGLDAPPRPTVYVNLFQRPRPALTLTMLSDADAQLVTTAARFILHELDPEVPARFRMFSQVYADSLGSRRFNAVLIGFFGISALVLALTGVFGVMSYSVSRRRREIGVRVALGAAAGDVLRMFLGQGLRTTMIGIAIGIVAALALTRTLASLLFGTTATDPPTFVGVTVLLVAAALVASYIPSRRATTVDPVVAMRDE